MHGVLDRNSTFYLFLLSESQKVVSVINVEAMSQSVHGIGCEKANEGNSTSDVSGP